MTDQIENIRMDRIDAPSYAMRTDMDAEKLRELAQSIKLYGLMSPITVRAVGKRFEIIAGHRRFCALELLQSTMATCIVKKMSDADTDVARMHENLFREDINPVDEAKYIRTLIDVHQLEPEALVAMTGKRVEYLKARYELLDYPDYLIDAIQHNSLSLGVAGWLVRIENENVRKEYTRFAISQGISAATARQWWESWKLGSLPREAADFIPPVLAEDEKPKVLMLPCVICRRESDVGGLQMHYAHGDCVHAVQQHYRGIEDADREEAPAAANG